MDGTGRPLTFGNASVTGGLYWNYVEAPASELQTCLGVICLINGRRVIVREARFGGVVAEPLTANDLRLPDNQHVIDLTRNRPRSTEC
ncbi:MAG: hypothetical protein KDA92_24520 [Planctomycetales bacterium]|nr:hypothetical protein [Planctomycetales bacterium]